MQKLLLLGDEAIAQGALDGGMSGIYAYPGTPSTEITEYVQRNKYAKENKIHSDWSANEKTAMESALGMSYAGKRAMVCMKHVGVNVAADVFMNSAITGVNGGLVITVADDPSMHSSQNEQDSRFYAKFAMIPVLEPSNQQEAYEMAYTAFDLSEKYNVPVMLRITTRLAHSRSGIDLSPQKTENKLSLPKDPQQFILLPSIARVQYRKLIAVQPELEKASEESKYNQYFDAKNKKIGVIACGLGYNYLLENFEDIEIPFSVVKVSQYPIPRNYVEKIMNECDEVLVLEDGYPIVEESLNGFMKNDKVKGRLTGAVPRDGELNPNIVAQALGLTDTYGTDSPTSLKGRPPQMCKGCGHIDVYEALNEVVAEIGEGRVFSDIGCYTLGALSPFRAINTCVDMGASITMAKGAADAGLIPSIAMIGDSTFTHSGMTGLLDAVIEDSPITVVISDNSTTGMTGGQTSHAVDRIFDICKGLGVHPDHLRTIIPLKKNHKEMVEMMKEEFAYNGLSVIVPVRECVQTASQKARAKIATKKMN